MLSLTIDWVSSACLTDSRELNSHDFSDQYHNINNYQTKDISKSLTIYAYFILDHNR